MRFGSDERQTLWSTMDEAPNLSSTVSPPQPALHARGHNPGGSRVDPASRRLDLNADMGESFGVWTLGCEKS